MSHAFPVRALCALGWLAVGVRAGLWCDKLHAIPARLALKNP